MAISEEIKELKNLIRILDNKYRLAILVLLLDKGEKSVGQVADSLEISFNTVSKNLLFLNKKGFLKKRYDGAFVLYSISSNLPKLVGLVIKSFSKKRE